MLKKSLLTYFILFLIVAAGFWFRFIGIKDNHSFWSDEAYISSVARDIVTNKKTITESLKTSGATYQPLNVLITAFSFKIFGVSEFYARLPYVIFGTLAIIFAFLLAKKISDSSGGLLAAFIMAFSQLQLANSTQAKPFIIIEVCLLAVLYLILLMETVKTKKNHCWHFLIIIVSILATLVNYFGIFVFVPYFIYLLVKNKNRFWDYLEYPKIILSLTVFLLFIFTFYRINQTIGLFGQFTGLKETFFTFNNITYFRELFWKNYGLFCLSAFFGVIFFFQRKKNLIYGLIAYIFIIFYLWNFKNYSHNIRYLIPFFGIIFIFFGVFWANIGDKLFHKKSWSICFLVAIIFYLGGDKIVRKPLGYYTPNNDLYGDVAMADYKTAYKKIEEKFADLSQIAVFNDLIDSQRYYLNKQADAYFTKEIRTPKIHPVDKKSVYFTLNEFLKEKGKYEKGILIVEDWESFLPEDIKQHAKKNMKLELRVEGLPQAGDDKWPIEVYSWGIN